MQRFLTLADVYRPLSANEIVSAQSAFMQNRINDLKMREAEKEIEKKGLRNELARQFYNPGTPASVEGRPAMSEGNVMGRYLPGGRGPDTYTPPETTVRPGTGPDFDYRGYGNAMAGAGDFEGAMEATGRAKTFDQQKRDRDIKVAQMKLDAMKPFYEKALAEGDYESARRMFDRAKMDPEISAILPDDIDIEFTPQGEDIIKYTRDFAEGELTDPTGRPLPAGAYTVKQSNRTKQIVEMVPYDKGVSGLKGAEHEASLRKEFDARPLVKDYNTVRLQVARMDEALDEAKDTDTFVAVDQALITIYNKMLDPTSVVRESEYARTNEDAALVNRIKAQGIRTVLGGRLTETERQAIVRMARRFADRHKELYNEDAQRYRRYAEDAGVNPDRVAKIYDGKKGSSDGAASAQSMTDEELLKELGL